MKKNELNNMVTGNIRTACLIGLWLPMACMVSAQKAFVISPDMKETEIIKKGMTEVADSVARAQYAQWYEAVSPLWQVADSASYAEAEAWFDNNCDDTKIADYKLRTKEAQSKYEEALENYLRAHSDEYPAAAIVARRLFCDFKFTATEYDEYVNMMENNPDTTHANFVRNNIGTAKKYALGNKFADFEGHQTDSTQASLSSLMQPGKWTLIDFWASWCAPCRAAIPKVKAMMEQYGDRLQVVSVSVDDKESSWREAEKKEAMTWPQLWLDKEQNEAATSAYAINTIPRLVLIDTEGKISLVTNDVNQICEKVEAE
ncbi:MAG: TlpA family protein disulfide reductase [Bacteroides sp.]|nr:TlpA family protein disulfide reductase [Roseburia sp.]MCM1347017.1 TlpA family protein disulfide reductase [Bacteroides sp.]MCM1421536.1 TlpA family protein disulfide reductase [Bacteroides sp.]